MKIGEFIYNDEIFNIYDEKTTSIEDIFEYETIKKWNYLKNRYNYNFYYISSVPKTNNQVFLKEKVLKKNKYNRLLRIKQSKDILKIIKNFKVEVVYVIPNIDENNMYYFNLLIITDFIINRDVLNSHDFEIIKPVFISSIIVDKLNIKALRNLLDFDKNLFCDILPRKSNKTGVLNREQFKLFCMHIYSFDLSDGKEFYGMDFIFGTNFFKNVNAFSVISDDNNINIFKNEEIFMSSISDNSEILKITQKSFKKF